MRAWLKAKAKLVANNTYSSQAGRRGINVLEDDELDQLTPDELHARGEMDNAEAHVFVRRRFGVRANPGGARTGAGAPPKPSADAGPPRRDPPPREASDARCANCLEKGHTSRECPKPRVDLKENRALSAASRDISLAIAQYPLVKPRPSRKRLPEQEITRCSA